MRITKSGYWLVETIVWMTIFLFLVISFSSNFNFSVKNFIEWKQEILYKNISDDIVGYLIAYKKNYGTVNFHHFISYWDSDNNCNWNFENADLYIRDYCYFYPYINWLNNNVEFYNSDFLFLLLDEENERVTINNNNQNTYNIDSFLKYYWITQSEINLTIWLKQNFSDIDLFEWFITITDLQKNVSITNLITIK